MPRPISSPMSNLLSDSNPRDPSLPAPSAEARAASRALVEHIGAEIDAQDGWIGFDRYMDLALYAPGLGYYAGGAAKLGPAGDFVTAPELGALFARTLARQVAALLRPGDAILELGAGTGALAAALLEELARLGHAPRYSILEASAELAARQRARLAAFGSRVQWLARLPQGLRGVIVANEVADALPVHALAWGSDEIIERGVARAGGGFAWSDRPASGALRVAAEALAVSERIAPPGGARYESEIGLAAAAWLRTLGDTLDSGALLVIDYGFPRRELYHPQRAQGTLMCHYRHRAHDDPFFLPGLQDITAHVDFSALAAAARDSGLELLGYATQAQFLLNCGLLELLAEQDPADAARYAPLAAEVNRLTSPAEMGELFKVLAVGRGVADDALLGFARGDRAHTL
jgi:SAM-dependent MidA family methyltransferase